MRRNRCFSIAIGVLFSASLAQAQPRVRGEMVCPNPRRPQRLRGAVREQFLAAIHLAETDPQAAARAFDELVDRCPNAHEFAFNAVVMHTNVLRGLADQDRATPQGRDTWTTALSRIERYLVSFGSAAEFAEQVVRVRALQEEVERLRPADPVPEPPPPVQLPSPPPPPVVVPPPAEPPVPPPVVLVPPPRFREVMERGSVVPAAFALGGGAAALIFSGLSLGWAVNSQAIADAWRASGSPSENAQNADRHARSVDPAYSGALISGVVGIGLGVVGGYLLTHRRTTVRRVPIAVTFEGLSLAF